MAAAMWYGSKMAYSYVTSEQGQQHRAQLREYVQTRPGEPSLLGSAGVVAQSVVSRLRAEELRLTDSQGRDLGRSGVTALTSSDEPLTREEQEAHDRVRITHDTANKIFALGLLGGTVAFFGMLFVALNRVSP